MRYRSTILIGVLTVFLLSPTYTNGLPGPQNLDGPPDLAVKVTTSEEILSASTSEVATLYISILNLWKQREPLDIVRFGSDASGVTVRITLPSEKSLSPVGNIGVDSGFTCKTTSDTDVLCWGGTIKAGTGAHISVTVAGHCSAPAPVTVEVDPTQRELTENVDRLTNNTATIYLLSLVNFPCEHP